MIATLESLRDIGNTVIVVEHDEDTIRAADHIVEMGPGPGRPRRRRRRAGHARRRARVQGVADRASSSRASARSRRRRRAGAGQRQDADRARRAREQPQDRSTSTFPLGHAGRDHRRVRLRQEHADQRDPLQGAVEAAGGHAHAARRARRASTALEHVHKVVNIDQSPIGRNSRSNPATYIGFYDTIRDLFTQAPLSVERGYKPGRFSFNVKGGRCEECQGEGVDHHAALLHARRRGDLRRLQGRALQQRDAGGDAARQDHRRRAEHVGRGGRRRSSRASRRSARRSRC